MNSLLLGFGYKARRGKDTAVQAIIDARSDKYDIRRYGFGDALKREVNQAATTHGGMLGLFTALASQLPSHVQYDPSPDMSDPLCPLGKQRSLLQWWGGEFRRGEDPFYWVKKLRDTLAIEKPQIALIADLRYLNEVGWIKHDTAGSDKIIRVDRHGYEESRVMTTTQAAHQSECELESLPAEKWDYIMTVNDGDVETLKKDAIYVFDHVIESMTPPADLEKFPDEQITEFAIDESKEEQEAQQSNA